jgi:pyruvate,water dikinase
METSYIASLKNPVSVEVGGGKAASLSHLIDLGLNVPAGFVVTTDAFRDHLSDLTDESESLEAGLESVSIRSTLEEEFRKAWEAYVSPPVALRSSATVEDSQTASFAGQFRTVLNVATVDEAMDELRRCWASSFSEHAESYRSTQRQSASVEMGVVVQEMVEPEYAGVAFTLDPVTLDKSVYYAEWTQEYGEMLVSGKDIAGRCWVDRDCSVLRKDCYGADSGPTEGFYQELTRALTHILDSVSEPQDVEWVWKKNTFHVVQSRAVTVQETHERPPGAPPEWVFPGRPAGGWTEKQHLLFDLWDEYNPSAIRPLDYDLYQGAVWQANIDMLEMEGNPPQVEHVGVMYRTVPVAVDPAARGRTASRTVPRAPSDRELRDVMPTWQKRTEQLRQELDETEESVPDLIEQLENIAKLYRETQVTRLQSMNQWIEGEEEAEQKLKAILSDLSFDTESTIETLRSGVLHKTHQMNQDLYDLAAYLRSHGESSSFEQKFNTFINEYRYFEYGKTLISESRKAIREQVETLAESEEASQNPVEEARARANQLEREVKEKLQEDQANALENALGDLRYWIQLREDSKVEQERPLPLLRSVLAQIGALLVENDILSEIKNIYLLTYEELVSFGSQNHTAPVTDRKEVVEWKGDRSWLPDSFRGEEHDKDDRILIGTSGSSGIAEGPARCIQGPDEFGDVEAGDILVARATNPVWTQLFGRIAGVVVENGTRLSHAAIVAREFGIPAVVGVPGAFDAITPGEPLRVDGTEGEVMRISVDAELNG